MNPLEERLKRRIAEQGPISVADFMAEANAHYYASRDPFGAAGDFITAPEISQMFGELVGVWLADQWLRAGKPDHVHYVELGPGRGTLAADALRPLRQAGLEPAIHLVETSPVLRAAQAKRLPGARWHDDLSTLPDDGALLVVANEFFDALPIHQYRDDGGELRVSVRDGRFVCDPAEALAERSPVSVEIARQLARRLRGQGGAALIVDYGYVDGQPHDTFQAVSRHQYVDPFEAPGEQDLTAHVDFFTLAVAAGQEGVKVRGPIPQGEWLRRMGVDARARALARSSPDHAGDIEAARARLIDPAAMGGLFKAMALVAPAWPEPAGF
jgi:NADH dehydrogenase [ubiquinone] 1 alpha subcomplex assembly factor 7